MLFDAWNIVLLGLSSYLDDLLRKDDRKDSLDMKERRRKEVDVVMVWGIADCSCAHVFCMNMALML